MAKNFKINSYNSLSPDDYQSRLLHNVPYQYSAHIWTYNLTFATSTTISSQDLESCFNLIAHTSKEDYENSSTKWRPRVKKAEMKDERMRYLLVHQTSYPSEVVGFASFMLDLEDGIEVVYLYEIHLVDTSRGLGLGKWLLDAVWRVGINAQVEKMMLTVFLRNTEALEWYTKLGFEVDPFSPEPKRLRGGVVKDVGYKILSKAIPKSESK